jgi:uncharacterized membrane protein SpoIIM required for sporulation
MKNFIHSVFLSVKYCKVWIVSVFITYCVSCLIGLILVHTGNHFALSYRDKLVGNAMKNDRVSVNYNKGNRFSAALLDFSGNLFVGAIPQTAIGLSVVMPYVTVAYQGWVGGIVSVDYKHQSRLKEFKTALYYLTVIILQFIPYSLAIGSGIRFGVETYKKNKNNKISKYRIDTASMKDVFRIYVIVIPLFFIASCFEFLCNWNY